MTQLPPIPKRWLAASALALPSWDVRVENIRRGWFMYLAEHFDLVPHKNCPKWERFELCWHLMDREVLQFWEDFRRCADRQPMNVVNDVGATFHSTEPVAHRMAQAMH
jgi:hypothetical protein